MVYVDGIKMARMAGMKQSVVPMWKKLMKLVDLGEPTSFLDHEYLGYPQRECKPNENTIDQYRAMFESRISAAATEKLRKKTVAWSYDMEGHAQQCFERHCELANKRTEQLYKVSAPCLDDHNFKKEELEKVGERLGLFQDSDFAGDLEDSKLTSGEILFIFGSRTFVPRSWMCKKQTSVSHSSTESEVISLDAGLRMDGILALDLWDVVIGVLHSFIGSQKIINPGSSWKQLAHAYYQIDKER